MQRTKPTRFCHVVYRTRRFEPMLQWYQAVFDTRAQFQNPVLAFLTYDDEHHRFAFVNLSVLDPQGSDVDRKGQIGVDHVAYAYDSLDQLLDSYEQLKALGIRPYWCVHHGITVSMYYRDPDGNQMEFQVDCFASNDATNAYMHGPHFSANPIGVEYDPDDWVARRRAGTPAADFLVRASDEPISPVRGNVTAGAD
ncbi:MAG: VOC family protein [Rubrivivax sp.]|nr:VOC family protein [Rubrivivax sp.]